MIINIKKKQLEMQELFTICNNLIEKKKKIFFKSTT